MVLTNDNASLRCTDFKKSSGGLEPSKGVIWIFHGIAFTTDKDVFKKPTLLYSPDNRWSVNETGGKSELIITNAKPEDAGVFRCITSTGQYNAQLVVFGISYFKHNFQILCTQRTLKELM